MKGKHHVNTSYYATEVFTPTGRNVEDAEVVICLNCELPECQERNSRDCKHFKTKVKELKEGKNANINV